jgi:glutathione peroxidase
LKKIEFDFLEQLQILYEKYKSRGLEILAFPCNQFGNQESWTERMIGEFVQSNFGVTFPVMTKVEVNGQNQHKLFQILKCESGCCDCDIRWNFAKFLVSSSGVQRFEHGVNPLQLEEKILEALQ